MKRRKQERKERRREEKEKRERKDASSERFGGHGRTQTTKIKDEE